MKKLAVTKKQENIGKKLAGPFRPLCLRSQVWVLASPAFCAVSTKLVDWSIARCHLAPVITIEGGERVGRTAARARHVPLTGSYVAGT